MQILIPDSWLREYLETNATPKQIQEALSLCGPSVERLHQKNGDFVYDIEVTTNRVDMMSVVGIARECAAILPRFGYLAKLKIKNQNVKLNIKNKVDYLQVILDKSLCHRFTVALINDIKVGESPKLVRERLELCGIRAINNVVDISNYLMLEMGQPVHTFDYDKIADHKMVLRKSKKGEKLTTLDGKEHTLFGGDIIMEDGSGKLIDLCGIMGGKNSSVDKNTKNILLFVQVYDTSHIRKTSMSLAHRTDAAVLFEKGLSVENVLPTLEMGIKMLAGTKETILDIVNVNEKLTTIKLTTPITEFINKRLGISLKFSDISNILKSLEFNVKSEYEVEVPWIRKLDITIPEDLVEEVARIYGYHNLPSQIMSGVLPTQRQNEQEFYWIAKIKSLLSNLGFAETYTYSLVSKDNGLKLKNALSSDWEYLRTNLTNSHLQIISENLGHQESLNFFEVANVYIPNKNALPKEKLHLVISTTNKDRLKLKGVIETVFNRMMNIPISLNHEIKEFSDCIIFEIDLSEQIVKAKTTKTYTPISKFPPIIEDINITLNSSYESLIIKIKKLNTLINQIDLVDKYGDKLTLRITYHDKNKQLSSEDIAPIREKLLALG